MADMAGRKAAAAWQPLRSAPNRRIGRRTASPAGVVALGCVVLAMTVLALRLQTPDGASSPTTKREHVQSRASHAPYVKVFAGPHTVHRFSRIAFAPWNWDISDERIGVVATGTTLAELLSGAVTLEWETLYAYHWGTQQFHELGGAFYLRWNRFPWNSLVRTTYAIGLGPSYTSAAAHYEPGNGLISKWLTQLNFELNLYHPDNPGWALIARLQHRSGAFGTIKGIRGGSNFLTLGFRRQF